MTKPRLWPQIEFFSSRGQESWHLLLFSGNLSSWGLVWDSSGQGKDSWSSSSLLSYQTCFLLYFTNSTVCLRGWMKHPEQSKWGALLCGSMVTSYGLWQKPVGGLYQLANAKRYPMSPLGDWPEMGKTCGLSSPFSVKLSSLFDHFITPWELELLT